MVNFKRSALQLLERLGLVGAVSVLASISMAVAQVPATMQAIVQSGTGGPEVLKLVSVPVPAPAENQVLLRIHAAGVNPIDWKLRSGAFGPPRGGGAPGAGSPGTGGDRQQIPGGEYSGVIVAIGSGVKQWKVGEAVYGSAPGRAGGGYAEYALGNAEEIAAKPKRLSYAQAAGIPTAGMTALGAVKQTAVGAGKTLVVVGAAGGVGSAAVQIAKANGARVIAVASSQHNEYLKKLGADELVNYDLVNPATRINGADAVINLVEGAATAVIPYVRRGGIVVLPAGTIDASQCAAAGITCERLESKLRTADGFTEINRLVDAGQYTVKVKTFPLAQAGDAQELLRAGHAEGKIIVVTSTAAELR